MGYSCIEFTCSISKSQKILSTVKSKMPGINFPFNVHINFCTNKCVNKNAVGVSNGQHFFFFFASTECVNPKEMAI